MIRSAKGSTKNHEEQSADTLKPFHLYIFKNNPCIGKVILNSQNKNLPLWL